jgi:hypothetical protein
MMRIPTTDRRQVAEDIYFGQIVIIWARWFVILAATILALWSTDSTGNLSRRAVMVIGLMGINFFLHGRSLMDKPVNGALLLATAVADLTIIGLMVACWGARGVESELYVLYYPIVFSCSLVFAPRIAAALGAATVVSYTAICFIAEPSILTHTVDAKSIVIRAITLAATVALGAYYWRIARQRRLEVADSPNTLGYGTRREVIGR